MTPAEFRQLLQEDIPDLARMCLRGTDVPFAFSGLSDAWLAFRDDLGQALGVKSESIAVVGSERFGFSLKPDNSLRPFSDTSDIDVVVVDSTAFDETWTGLLRALYPRPPIQVSGWLAKCRNDLYTGWLCPLAMRPDRKIYGARAGPVLEISSRWFQALKVAGRFIPQPHESLQARLYRTWEHAELYHQHSLHELKRTLNQ